MVEVTHKTFTIELVYVLVAPWWMLLYNFQVTIMIMLVHKDNFLVIVRVHVRGWGIGGINVFMFIPSF
jgi:hypothetical protein